MRKIKRGDVMGLGSYEEVRERALERIIQLKKNRRVSLGEHLTFILENRDTMLFQVQEMLRTERITQESSILHEIGTYNELVPDAGELSCTLMVEYDEKAERAKMLEHFSTLPEHLRLEVGDERAPAVFQKQAGEEDHRLPAVNYLRFSLNGQAMAGLKNPETVVRLVSDHPEYTCEQAVPENVRGQMLADLAEE